MIGQRKSSAPQSAPSSPSNRPGAYMPKLAETGSVQSVVDMTYLSADKLIVFVCQILFVLCFTTKTTLVCLMLPS